jgi:hypothetical protein
LPTTATVNETTRQAYDPTSALGHRIVFTPNQGQKYDGLREVWGVMLRRSSINPKRTSGIPKTADPGRIASPMSF